MESVYFLSLSHVCTISVCTVLYHDSQDPQFPWNDDDVEIGRCISRELNVQCSTSHEVCPHVCLFLTVREVSCKFPCFRAVLKNLHIISYDVGGVKVEKQLF